MKSHFITPLRAEHLGGRWWKLTSPMIYYSEILNDTIVIPKGFVTDFASVPRLPIIYWFFGSRGNSAAAVHDLLYRWGTVSRLQADAIYLESMKVYGQCFFTRYPMYAGVVVGGWWAYKNIPGCLDYRGCNRNCTETACFKYHPNWNDKEYLINEPADRAFNKKTMFLNNNI